MANARAVLIDDEPSLLKFVSQNLRARGYEVACASSGREGIELVKQFRPDLVLLDIGLPGMDGFEVCEQLRTFSDAAIVVVTASARQADKLRVLDLGADDYLIKPFAVGELMARVRAVMRRYADTGAKNGIVDAGNLRLDFQHRRVTLDGSVVKLTPTEFSLLEQLATRPGQVVAYRMLLSAVWGDEHADDIECLRLYVGRLRRKLEADPAKPRHLVTESGRGYCFAG